MDHVKRVKQFKSFLLANDCHDEFFEFLQKDIDNVNDDSYSTIDEYFESYNFESWVIMAFVWRLSKSGGQFWAAISYGWRDIGG